MKLGELHIDRKADAMYIDVAEGHSRRTEVASPGIMIDYDESDRIVGIEVLYLSKRASEVDLQPLLVESEPATS